MKLFLVTINSIEAMLVVATDKSTAEAVARVRGKIAGEVVLKVRVLCHDLTTVWASAPSEDAFYRAAR